MKRTLVKNFFSSTKATKKTKNPAKQVQLLFEGGQNDIIPKILRGKHRVHYSLEKGQIIHDFQVKNILELAELNLKAYHLEHTHSKSQYIHIDSSDMNNVFSFILLTPNIDQKGLPLIMEKMLQCGSQNYNIRDPFKQLSETRSLNTHSEPETGKGYISFPFSTTNEKDFQNLMSLYSDSIYRNNLNKMDFLNESFRYEFRDLTNPQSDLTYQGNSYEEVKNLSFVPDYIIQNAIYDHFFKNDPDYSLFNLDQIKKTTYEDIKWYYYQFITPSRTHFYSYGDLDFTKHLEYLSQTILSEKNIEYSTLKAQEIPQKNAQFETFKQDRIKEVRLTCAPSFGNPDQGSMIAQSFLCNQILTNPEATVQLNALSYLLFELPDSPFFQQYLFQGIAPAYINGYGLDNSSYNPIFTIGFKDLQNDVKYLHHVDREILSTLKQLERNGFDKYLVDLGLHQLETQATQRVENLGLSLLQNLLPYIVYSSPNYCQQNQTEFQNKILDILKLTNFRELESQIKKDHLLQKLVKTYFLDNTKQLRILMTPDTAFIQKKTDAEHFQLKAIKQDMKEEQKEEIVKQSTQLERYLGSIQDFSQLPALQPQDIEPLVERFEHKEDEIDGCPIIYTDQEINKQSYIRIKFDVSDIPPSLYEYLDLFAEIFPSIGSTSIKEDSFAQLIDLYSDSLEMKEYAFQNPEDQNQKKVLVFKFSFLNKNTENCFNLINDLLSNPNFTSFNKLSELLMYKSSEIAHKLTTSTLDYGLDYSQSFINPTLNQSNKLFRARQLCDHQLTIMRSTATKQKLKQLLQKLQEIYTFIAKRQRISFMITSNPKIQPQISKRLHLLLLSMKQKNPDFDDKINLNALQTQNKSFIPAYKKLFMPLPITSNFVIESFNAPRLMDKERPTMHLMGELMKNTVLKPELQEKKGAYQAGYYLSHQGAFNFFSYRDSQTLSTYEVFEDAAQYVYNNDFSGQELDEAKISIFSQLNQDINPENKGELLFIYGMTDKLRKLYRDSILGTSGKDVQNVAKDYIIDKMAEDESNKLIIGQQDVNLEGLLKRGWKIERPIEDISVQHQSYEQIKDEHFRYFDII